MKKVFITRKIPEEGIRLLESKNIKVILNEKDVKLSSDELLQYSKGVDGIICLLSDKFDRELISRLKSVKIIANYAVGYNNIDVDACKENGIYVSNTPDVLTQTTADLGFGLMMAVARKIPQSHNYTIAGRFKGWGAELMLGHDIFNSNLGIIGLGRIGTAIGKRALGFNMNVSYYSRTRKNNIEDEYGFKYCTLYELAKNSDYILICCPLTDETHHLIDGQFISKMKKNSFIINISRGPVIDEKALLNSLINKKIAGCGLDVYENEPEFDSKFLELDNVVLLPHIGSASINTRNIMSKLAAENVIDVIINNQVPRTNVYWDTINKDFYEIKKK